MRPTLLALLPLMLLGCPSEPEPETCATGEPETWVIRQLTFARRDAGVVPGFDLDAHDSGDGDSTGCGHPDLIAPDGTPGVDNNFSGLVPILEASEAVAAESLIKQAIASGELLLMMTLDGVDSWQDDTCVDFTLSRGAGTPLVGPDGVILDHQTLALDPTVAEVQVSGAASDLRIEAEGLSFNLPLSVLNATELDFQVSRGVFQLQRRHDGVLTGVMGGVIPIRQIVEILERDDVNLQQFIPVVEGFADVQDDAGACTGLSLAFEFEAIPAWIVE